MTIQAISSVAQTSGAYPCCSAGLQAAPLGQDAVVGIGKAGREPGRSAKRSRFEAPSLGKAGRLAAISQG